MTPRVRLVEGDLWLARQIALYRSTFDRSAGIVSRKMSRVQSDTDIDLDGAVGEIAVAKLYGVTPGFDWLGVDRGFDLMVGGVQVDVKATRHSNGQLLVRPRRDGVKPDAYVLAVIESEWVVRVPGWASARDVAERGRPFSGDTVAVPQARLRPPGELWLAAQIRRLSEQEQHGGTGSAGTITGQEEPIQGGQG